MDNRVFLKEGDYLFDYKIESIFGAGGNGICYKAIKDGKYYCVKEIYPAGEDLTRNKVNNSLIYPSYVFEDYLNMAKREVEMSLLAKGEADSLFWASLAIDDYPLIVMETAQCMSFYEKYRDHSAYRWIELPDSLNRKTFLSLNTIESLRVILEDFLKLLEAVEKIHDNGILHLDLSPRNCLITDSRVVVCDMGSAVKEGEVKGNLILGTDGYASPEVIAARDFEITNSLYLENFENPYIGKIGRSSDYFSLGCILYFLITGKRLEYENNTDLFIVSAMGEGIIDGLVKIEGGSVWESISKILLFLLYIPTIAPDKQGHSAAVTTEEILSKLREWIPIYKRALYINIGISQNPDYSIVPLMREVELRFMYKEYDECFETLMRVLKEISFGASNILSLALDDSYECGALVRLARRFLFILEEILCTKEITAQDRVFWLYKFLVVPYEYEEIELYNWLNKIERRLYVKGMLSFIYPHDELSEKYIFTISNNGEDVPCEKWLSVISKVAPDIMAATDNLHGKAEEVNIKSLKYFSPSNRKAYGSALAYYKMDASFLSRRSDMYKWCYIPFHYFSDEMTSDEKLFWSEWAVQTGVFYAPLGDPIFADVLLVVSKLMVSDMNQEQEISYASCEKLQRRLCFLRDYLINSNEFAGFMKKSGSPVFDVDLLYRACDSTKIDILHAADAFVKSINDDEWRRLIEEPAKAALSREGYI